MLGRDVAVRVVLDDVEAVAVRELQDAVRFVDPQSQRVAFTVGNDPNTVFETGLYNLTQNATPVLLHQGPTQTQTWVFARLPEPKEEQATTTAAVPQQPAPTVPPAEDLRRE